ncbi:hypothetical protein BTW15_06500 [Pseudomonas syringae pv. tomato]|uniref:Uncharacterized protein n=3 Tax=Pseudomonas syringae group genomosp. 3 TaxID=251701 RepID=Q87XS7_PSESM|nr:hypothetical protein PSPTO_4099 [Pseudomonas syringae pv. tomato str. DC3000]AVI86161.1 hypothetical protein XJ28_21935 [Pseudomonas syringae pv. tomato]KPB80107.1 Uncharacterized protein AC505_1229 [Pseudomonas syringae pv. maculicola]KPC11381.1 Uncharacterized protein AC506_3921 [Pseudomonas syringae pv. maculicola str. M6]KPC12984.1 Uncharacterized protein AC500_1959 [Pseudomonas amygdali pv. lachrymans]KPW27291.1 Uncharacterized protein ALO87_04610 [Pseudomonas syringae pv. apii]MCF522
MLLLRRRTLPVAGPPVPDSVSPVADCSLNRHKIHAADDVRWIICLTRFN